jgi:hypothetical protein
MNPIWIPSGVNALQDDIRSGSHGRPEVILEVTSEVILDRQGGDPKATTVS